MKKTAITEPGLTEEGVAAWIGLDWADDEHKVCLYDEATGKIEEGTLKHTPEMLRQWVTDLRSRYGGAKVAIALEQSRGGLIHALMGTDFIVLYPVNPKALARYRDALYPSGAKDDPVDAALLMDLVRKHAEKFRAWKPDDANTRSLRLLVEGRRKIVNQVTRTNNQMTSHLKTYFPQALQWAGEMSSLQACDFLEQWPTLEAVQQVRPGRLRKFYNSHGRPSAETVDGRLEQIKQAVPLTDDPAAVLAGSTVVKSSAALMRTLIAILENYDDEIKRLFQNHPDRLLFETLPGAGEVLAPRLLAVFGADRDRWKSAVEIQQLYGVAPVTERSGKTHRVHWRYACASFMRQSLHEFAGSSIVWCDWAKAYYTDQIGRGKSHHRAVRALAYKWTRILFVCWKTRTQYDDKLYMKTLAKRGSRIAELALAVQQTRQSKVRKSRKKVAQSVEKTVDKMWKNCDSWA